MGGVNHSGKNGYALLDVVLAVALFGISVTGLVKAMQQINSTSASFARDRMIQQNIEAMLAEKRRLPVGEMTSELHDQVLDITFRSYVEPVDLDNGEGNELTDMYRLTAEAVFFEDGGEQIERAELYLYQTEE